MLRKAVAGNSSGEDVRNEKPGEPAQCFHHLFESQVERFPDAIAATFDGRKISYHDLNRRANRLAHHLRSLGVAPDVLVGTCMDPSIDVLIAFLGVLKAGGATVPLDPSYPEERLAFMLKDTKVPVLLTQERVASHLPESQAQILFVDAAGETLGVESEENGPADVRAHHLAYVLYTSGSTGTPKGVLVEHRGLCNLSREQKRIFGTRPQDRVLQFASLGFDASIWDITMALGAGATLCFARRESLLPGPELVRLLRSGVGTGRAPRSSRTMSP